MLTRIPSVQLKETFRMIRYVHDYERKVPGLEKPQLVTLHVFYIWSKNLGEAVKIND